MMTPKRYYVERPKCHYCVTSSTGDTPNLVTSDNKFDSHKKLLNSSSTQNILNRALNELYEESGFMIDKYD